MQNNRSAGPFQISNHQNDDTQNNGKSLHWTKEEFIKYSVFLTYAKRNNFPEIQEPNLSWGFFRKAAIFLQTKNPNQCRIYHKKKSEGLNSLESFMQQSTKKIQDFQGKYTHYESSIRNVMTCLNREKKQAILQQAAQNQMLQQKKDNLIIQKKMTIELNLHQKDKQQHKPTGTDYPEETPIFNQKVLTFNKKESRPSCGFSLYQETEEHNPSNSLQFFKPRSATMLSFEDRLDLNAQKGLQLPTFFNFMKPSNLGGKSNQL